ncbi:MAG: c-type cytochrome biogenesis protein CcmI [Panacagrimonas sp.]
MVFGLMALLALAAGFWLTRPLWRIRLEAGQRRRAANVAAYRQRLAEIEADQAAALLDVETATGLRAELDLRLMRDAEPVDAEAVATSRHPLFASGLGAVVLAIAVAGYGLDGSWKVQQQVASGVAAPATGEPPGSVEDMVATLQKKLEKDPEDLDGWAMLGRSQFVLQRYVESARAYARANELAKRQEPDLLVNEGEALALSRDRDLLGRPRQLFDEALALAPDHAKALWYGGLAAEQGGEYAVALQRWTALSKMEVPQELRPILAERLQLAAERSGSPVPVVAAGVAAAEAPTSAPAAAAPGASGSGEVAIQVSVKVKPELVAKVVADATLFVFAKAASGPPMPLAVYRGKASELPREVRLDDSMGMVPALKLSQFESWTVTARLTRSGGVQAISGDLQGSLTVARGDLGKGAMVLTIDQVVP